MFTTPGIQNAVVVETLSPAFTYQFSVVAENPIGNSSASEPLSFATLGLAPDVAPFNLSTVTGLRSVNISVEVSRGRRGALGVSWREGGMCMPPDKSRAAVLFDL